MKNWKKGLFISSFLLFFVFVSACSGQNEESKNENEKQEEEIIVDKEEPEEEIEEEKPETVHPTDEELIRVLEVNGETLKNGDIDSHMETIHDDSPFFESTRATMEQLMALYEFDIEIWDLKVIEKSIEEAKVTFTQRTSKASGPDFRDNETSGYHILRPKDGVWKIYNTIQESIVYLDEVVEELPEQDEDEYVYIDYLDQLNIEFDDRNWVLDYYAEDVYSGTAIAEFVLEGESVYSWSELYTIHLFEDGVQSFTIQDYADSMEFFLNESILFGTFEFSSFDITADNGYYEFIVKDDVIEDDQHELARLFVHGTDILVIRYTVIGEELDEQTRQEWLDRLDQVYFP